jgi:general secretion pathway protein C
MTTAIIKSGFNSWTLRLFTLSVWLWVGLSGAYWAFKFVTTQRVEATAALAASTIVVDSKAVAKLLGATDNIAVKPINTVASNKFFLFGLASSASGQGVALIALDGKPAKPYRVGSLVADDLLLKSISKTGVMLATSLKATEGVTLELPERKPANTLVAPPRFPVLNPSNVNPAPAPNLPLVIAPAMPPAVQPSGAVPGAAAAISRFAPQATSQMADVQAPSRIPVPANSASVAER